MEANCDADFLFYFLIVVVVVVVSGNLIMIILLCTLIQSINLHLVAVADYFLSFSSIEYFLEKKMRRK